MLNTGCGPAYRRIRVCATAIGIALLGCAGRAGAVAAQEGGGVVQGRVTAEETAEPLRGVRVYVQGTTRGGLTGQDGRYRIDGVPEGRQVVVFEFIGRRVVREPVEVALGAPLTLDAQLAVEALAIDNVVVSATREMQSLAETAASVGVVQSSEIRETRP